MPLTIYNTKTKALEVFSPINPTVVTMYTCGPTVYDKTHIGHMRKYIGDDILRRTLLYLGYEVTHVMNITDVGHLTDDSDTGDDKFEKVAEKQGKSVWDIAAYYTDYFNETMRAANVLTPSIECKATDHIPSMIALVQQLYEKGYAYETHQAVYFDTSKDADYGSLSGQKLEQKNVAVRDDVNADPAKLHPADFALWFKRVDRFAAHTMYWPSPWGDGFPGWHIECSAMSMQYLGETIDIHTGGIDHIPVHHENEIAQSECATGKTFVHYWVHHDFLLVDGEKMSKSKNNFYTVEDIRGHGIDPVAVRLLCMQTSYRKSLNFTWTSLQTAASLLTKLQIFAAHTDTVGNVLELYREEFVRALSQDLNTAKVLALITELLSLTTYPRADVFATLLEFDAVLGLDLATVPKFFISTQAHALVEKRNKARQDKDFAASDTLRAELMALGYEVLDTNEGTVLQ